MTTRRLAPDRSLTLSQRARGRACCANLIAGVKAIQSPRGGALSGDSLSLVPVQQRERRRAGCYPVMNQLGLQTTLTFRSSQAGRLPSGSSFMSFLLTNTSTRESTACWSRHSFSRKAVTTAAS